MSLLYILLLKDENSVELILPVVARYIVNMQHIYDAIK